MRVYPIDLALGSFADHPVTDGVEEQEQRTMESLYPRWHAEAACLGLEDSVFFGATDPEVRPQYNLSDIKSAKAICDECPVKEMCLTAALAMRERYGVWAGTTPKQRIGMLSRVDAGETVIETEVENFFSEGGR